MTRYFVTLCRAMRLSFVDVEAATPEAAAEAVRNRPSDEADNVEDDGGEDLSARVDLPDDHADLRFVTFDFEGERARKAAARLLTALKAVLPYAEAEQASLGACRRRDGGEAIEAEMEACGRAVELATATIAGAELSTSEINIHDLLAGRRQVADLWAVEDVQSVRPDLDDGQAWQVLQATSRHYDATIGINWDVLECHAERSFGEASDATEAMEASPWNPS